MNNTEVLDNPNVEELTNKNNLKSIIVYNDDHNTFEHVIRCFIEILNHSSTQAEQCTHLIHFKGKASVKSGTLEELKPYKNGLTNKGLSAIIK